MAQASKRVRKTRRQKRTTSLARKQARGMFTELFKTRALLAAVLLAKRTVTLAEHDLSEATSALVNGTGRINTVELPGKFLRLEFVIHKAVTKGFDLPEDEQPETVTVDELADMPSLEEAVVEDTRADATGHP